VFDVIKAGDCIKCARHGGFSMIKMSQEDKTYFKNGVKTLCGTELLFVVRLIEDEDLVKVFESRDLEFMKHELGRQAGAVWKKLLRAFKKKDFKEVEKILTGGTSE